MIPAPRRPPLPHTQDHVAGATRHRYGPVVAGDRETGTVKAWLYKQGWRPPFLSVNVAHLTGLTIDMSVDDARQLRDGLDALLKQAGDR